MRGESRRCKGSNEPLRRLPDGALATRRIVSFSVRCGGGVRRSRAARAQRARRLVGGAHKGVQQALDLQSCPGGSQAQAAFTGYRRNE